MKVVLPEPVSVTIWRYGVFEEDVCFYFMALLRPGDVCIDIGGHFGFFSMLARELVGRNGTVVTFEPMPSTREILIENMDKNAAPSNHHLIASAAGDVAGQLTFKDFGLTGSAFATSAEQRNITIRQLGEVVVDVRTVDGVAQELGLSSLRLLKIDAENAEYEVVNGSQDVLRTLRPAVILEAGDAKEGATRRVVDLVMSEGYAPYEFHGWTLRPHTPAKDYGYQNLLLIPSEKAEEMIGPIHPVPLQ